MILEFVIFPTLSGKPVEDLEQIFAQEWGGGRKDSFLIFSLVGTNLLFLSSSLPSLPPFLFPFSKWMNVVI